MAIAMKPFLLVLLALLILRRQFRAAAWALGACVVMLTAGGVIFGWNNLDGWISLIRTPPSTEYFQHLLNASLMGVASRAGLPSLSGAAASLIVLLATAWRLRLVDEDWAWLLVLVAGLLASPLGHMYHAPIFLGPIVGTGSSTTTAATTVGHRALHVSADWPYSVRDVTVAAPFTGFGVHLGTPRTLAQRFPCPRKGPECHAD